MKNQSKIVSFTGILILMICAAIPSCWPDFHPEKSILNQSYHWVTDMMFHGVYYYLLSLLITLFFYRKINNFFFYFLLIFGFSFILEIIQIWIPGRTFTLLDLLSNMIGIITAIITSRLIKSSKFLTKNL